jgi:ubiquinone biosynthesis protein COQ4
MLSLQISLAERLKAIDSFVALTRNPATFDAIYDLDEILRQENLSTISIEYLKSQPGVAAIIQERYLAPVPNLTELLTYPQDSLGYCFAAHLVDNQFEPEFYRKREVTDDISYVSLRRSQTHDIHHIVTGFGTDPSGELGLQAFQLAQMRSPIALALLTAGIINVFDNPDVFNTYMKQIALGWELGLKAKPLMAQKWEENWEKSLVQWRIELGLEPISMSFNPAIAA